MSKIKEIFNHSNSSDGQPTESAQPAVTETAKPTAKQIDDYFNAVYNDTFRKVSRFVVSKCSGLSDCEDVIQEVYTRFFRRISKKGFADIESAEAFLINIAKFECRNYFAVIKKTSSQTNFSEYSDEEFSFVEAEMSRDAPALEGIVENEILAKQIFDDISETDKIAGKIFYLYFAEDLKLDEIAKILDMNVSSVKTKLYRTLDRLKKKFSI